MISALQPVSSVVYTRGLPKNPVRLVGYDVLGREVALLFEGEQAVGTHDVGFDASALPSGVYLYVLEVGTQRLNQTMLVTK